MSVRLGLLAILDHGSCYGYQLRTELDRRTGSTGPINVGQVYNTLDRLERDKLVRRMDSGASDRPGTKPSNYYEITDAGRSAVREWFSTPSTWAELPGKVALAMTLPGVDAHAILRTQRVSAERALADVSEVNEADGNEAHAARALIGEAIRESAHAELRFLETAERMLAAGVTPDPLSTEIPRRGRPAKNSGS